MGVELIDPSTSHMGNAAGGFPPQQALNPPTCKTLTIHPPSFKGTSPKGEHWASGSSMLTLGRLHVPRDPSFFF